MISNDLQRAWLAGLFDGEGNVGFYRIGDRNARSGYVFRLVARISMTHAPTVRRVAELTGCGSIRRETERRRQAKPLYSWQSSCRDARGFLSEILPFSVTKAEEIVLALAGESIKATAPRVRYGKERSSIAPETEMKMLSIVDEIKAVKARGYK